MRAQHVCAWHIYAQLRYVQYNYADTLMHMRVRSNSAGLRGTTVLQMPSTCCIMNTVVRYTHTCECIYACAHTQVIYVTIRTRVRTHVCAESMSMHTHTHFVMPVFARP